MEKYVLRHDIEYFRQLLDVMITDKGERQRLLKIIAEEIEEQKAAGDLVKNDEGRH